jgi:aspartate aminotransferase
MLLADRAKTMVVAEKIRSFHARGSAIRQMFTVGLAMKAEFGAEAVADLSIGNPNFPPPSGFSEALDAVVRDARTHAYMPNAGFPDVRRRVARHLNGRGILPGVESRHLVMTNGAAGALNVVLKTILDPGDEVLLVRPYFVEYGFYIDNHGGTAVPVDSREDCNLDCGAIDAAITSRTKAILINSPNNPSGRVYDAATLAELAATLEDASHRVGHPVFLISDEPYREILFEGAVFTSPAAAYPNSFLCYSWSKSFSISGERIGYIAVNPALETDDWPLLEASLAMCNRILGFVNAPALMQRAIAASIDATPEIEHYRQKRARLLAALDQGGYRYQRPEGTFYIFPEAPGGETEFVERARARRLLVVPGSSFGRPDHFRLCFAAPESVVDRAIGVLLELSPLPSG